MANQKCAICGAEINLFQQQKLADGNYICRKVCQKKGFKELDYVHGNLPQVQAHIAQVEFGTKVWNDIFVAKRKEKKLKRFGSPVYVAEDIGLMALVETSYKIFIFGKTERACVYRIADLVQYEMETEQKTNSEGKPETQYFCHFYFRNVEGLSDFRISIGNSKSYDAIAKYFNELFGIQKTLSNLKNTWSAQMDAIKAVGAGLKAVANGEENVEEKAATAADALDVMTYGDRTEWIRKADETLAKYK